MRERISDALSLCLSLLHLHRRWALQSVSTSAAQSCSPTLWCICITCVHQQRSLTASPFAAHASRVAHCVSAFVLHYCHYCPPLLC